MSVKFIAIVDNIFYAGKRYSIGKTVLVDDSEAEGMNAYWWKNFSEWEKEQEKVVSEKQEMTDSEKDIEIKALKEQVAILAEKLNKKESGHLVEKKVRVPKKKVEVREDISQESKTGDVGNAK